MTHNVAQESPCFSQYILLAGLQEIIGKAGLNALFNLANLKLPQKTEAVPALTLQDTNLLGRTLNTIYGPRGSRGIALRAGRASFNYYLKEHDVALKFSSSEFKFLPHRFRMKEGLYRIASKLNNELNTHIGMTENAQSWQWSIPDCPECQAQQGEDYSCQFTVGFLQEYLSWAGGGKYFSVSETECRSHGNPACVFWMEKKPLE